MKLSRKLIPAMIMLLVSAVLMSTASFAWFSVNSQVTATGLTVTAVAPASLWIMQDDDTVRVTAIDLENENTSSNGKQFSPVTPNSKATANAWTFKTLTGDAAQFVAEDGTIAEGKADWLDTTNYHYMDTIKLALDGQTGQKTMINAQHQVVWGNKPSGEDARTEADGIYKAIHVALVSGSTVIEFDTAALNTYSAAQNFIELTAAAEATEVYVYVWIEGTDTDCKNANAYNLDNFTVSIIFNLGSVTVSGDGADDT